ncbi:ribonuclease E/G [Iodidimonas sp. SYSU 1G8]|uniref:ribonuclease E/G n=1 Tax=Iodidimonas sp. SYSU 1G8 TaxID=3133967 RepID=UPI0031FF0F94
MTRALLIDAVPGEVRAALIEDGEVAEIHIDREGHESLVGNIYVGRVAAVEPSLQAAFVTLPGTSLPGFLSAKHVGALVEDGDARRIERVVHQGELLLVEATRDPVGDKGPGLTTLVTLPGRLLVYHPFRRDNVLSGAIREEAQRARLEDAARQAADAVGDGGFVIRTAAQSAAIADILDEARALRDRWLGLKARAAAADTPACLQTDLPPAARILRDLARPGLSAITVDGRALHAEARAHLQRGQPELLPLLEVHAGHTPLFEAAGIEAAIDSLLETRLDLDGGGWITVETGEALTVIDVNSGDGTAESSREQTAFTTNLRAAPLIARQIRLRDIGGMILIDFIHMESPKHRDRVLDTLREALAGDRSPASVLGWSRMGLCEVSRRRGREALPDFLAGRRDIAAQRRRRTAESTGYDVLRRLRAEAAASPGARLAVTAHPAVIAWLEARPEALSDIAGKPPLLTADGRRPLDRPEIQPHIRAQTDE